MRDEERRIGAGLGTGIFVLPQIFGWAVLRPGYGLVTRVLVFTYMILSSIPFYFLASTLLSSGGDIRDMARNFDRNRRIAGENMDSAHQYMDEYEKGDLTRSGGAGGENAAAAMPTSTDAVSLARRFETDRGAADALRGPITIKGTVTGSGTDGAVYLQGSETYPAVTLRFAANGTAYTSGETVEAQCAGPVTLGAAGPVVEGCR